MTIILAVAGIAVTLLVFFLVDRKTRGARREREKHAHRDIVATSARLLAQNQEIFHLHVMEALIRSKSREYDVNLSVADEVPSIVEDIVARLTDSEFISSRVRGKLVEKAFALQEVLGLGNLL